MDSLSLFDLFIGSWEVRDAQAHGISHWLVIPCLFFTFMFGPVGLLLYFILRTVRPVLFRLDTLKTKYQLDTFSDRLPMTPDF